MGTSALPPIDGNAWTAYITGGRRHFDRVVRSRNVFIRNANELVGLLTDAEHNILHALALMEAGPAGDTPETTRQEFLQEAEAYRDEFWQALDQRLHNLVASLSSLVDQTRPLIAFYVEEPAFQQEFQRRNGAVAGHVRSKFVKRLRNYLLHAGVAPLVQSMRLGGDPSGPHLEIKLSSQGLLLWSGFTGEVRQFIEDHGDGLPLRRLVREYVTDMVGVYAWLLEQYTTLHETGTPPRHLREGHAPEILYRAQKDDRAGPAAEPG